MDQPVKPKSIPPLESLIRIFQAKGPDARAWEDVTYADYIKAQTNNFDTRVVFTAGEDSGSPPPDVLGPPTASNILHTCYGVYYDGRTGGTPGWVSSGSGPTQYGKWQAESSAFLPGYTVRRLALIEYPEEGGAREGGVC